MPPTRDGGAVGTIAPMEHARTEEPRRAPQAADATAGESRLATVAWLACSALLVALVVVLWIRVGDESSGAMLGAALIEGERPVAPSLPQRGLDGDGAPGLPSWYRAGDPSRAAGAGGTQPLLVNFWASWCGPCEDEAPELREISEDYAGRVTVVGVNAGSEDLESDARAFVRTHEFTFPIVRGDRATKDAWDARSYPETWLIGSDGRLSAHVNGPIDDEHVRALLDTELRKRRT